MTEEFRKDVDKTSAENVRQRISVYVYELNLLLRLARTYDVPVYVDTVERAGYTEVIVQHDGG